MHSNCKWHKLINGTWLIITKYSKWILTKDSRWPMTKNEEITQNKKLLEISTDSTWPMTQNWKL